MSQTTFNVTPAVAFAGLLGDSNQDGFKTSRYNGEASAMPFGIGVKQDTDQEKVKLYTTGAQLAGVLVHTPYLDNRKLSGALGLDAAEMGNVLRSGRIWVTAEGTVAAGAQAYCRHTSDGGSNTQQGTWRGDVDGVAQVTTVTPTLANTTLYSLDVFAGGRPFHFEYTSDGTATAIEICDGLRAVMVADAAFTALISVPGAGAATLVMTAVSAGVPFQVYTGGSPGAYTSITLTTPASTRADLAVGCRFVTATTGAGLALLEVNLPQ